MVDDWSNDTSTVHAKHRSKSVVVVQLKQTPFGRVKDAVSAGASSTIIQPTGKEFYSRYIWWSIIGGVR